MASAVTGALAVHRVPEAHARCSCAQYDNSEEGDFGYEQRRGDRISSQEMDLEEEEEEGNISDLIADEESQHSEVEEAPRRRKEKKHKHRRDAADSGPDYTLAEWNGTIDGLSGPEQESVESAEISESYREKKKKLQSPIRQRLVISDDSDSPVAPARKPKKKKRSPSFSSGDYELLGRKKEIKKKVVRPTSSEPGSAGEEIEAMRAARIERFEQKNLDKAVAHFANAVNGMRRDTDDDEPPVRFGSQSGSQPEDADSEDEASEASSGRIREIEEDEADRVRQLMNEMRQKGRKRNPFVDDLAEKGSDDDEDHENHLSPDVEDFDADAIEDAGLSRDVTDLDNSAEEQEEPALADSDDGSLEPPSSGIAKHAHTSGRKAVGKLRKINRFLDVTAEEGSDGSDAALGDSVPSSNSDERSPVLGDQVPDGAGPSMWPGSRDGSIAEGSPPLVRGSSEAKEFSPTVASSPRKSKKRSRKRK
jgi:hypothetical protein